MLNLKNCLNTIVTVTYVALHFEEFIKWVSILSDKKNLIITLAVFNVLFIILFDISYKSTYLSLLFEDIDFISPCLNLTKIKSK
jgi:hypothetical protein